MSMNNGNSEADKKRMDELQKKIMDLNAVITEDDYKFLNEALKKVK